MPHRGRRYVQLWSFTIVALIALLILNATQSYRAFSELVENESEANNTKQVLRTIKDVYSGVQNAELGLRGFLLSGNELYLDPYFKSLQEINLHLNQLKRFDYQLAGQGENVAKLEEMIAERLTNTARHIENKEQNPKSIMLSNNWMLQSYNAMTAIGTLVNAMESAEYELLAEQSQRAHVSRVNLRTTLWVANAVGIILIVLVAIQVRRAMLKHQAETERLEMMVQARTQELQHYSNELQRSNRELQDFAFVASHDLQEPLRKIRAFGDRVKKLYAGKTEQGEDYINRMQAAASRMSNLIEDLLAFSRVSTRSEPFKTVDLNLVLEEVLDNIEVKLQETNAIVHTCQLPTIEADNTQMHQLLQNLIANGIKFVAPDTRPEITLRCGEEFTNPDTAPELKDKGFYRLEVEDNGIGIDNQYIEKIFTPFQRLHGKETYEGTGIGLAICRRIVERHQGRLEVISEPGKGSNFVIYLPITLKQPLLVTENPTATEATE